MGPRPPPTKLRLALGFVLAPLAAPLLHAAVELAQAGWTGGPHVPCAFANGVFTALAVTGPLAYALALVVGVPLVLSLRALGRLTATWLLPASTLTGAVAPTAILFASEIACVGEPDCRLWPIPLEGAVLAAIVSGAYCAIAGIPPGRARGPAGARSPTSASSP